MGKTARGQALWLIVIASLFLVFAGFMLAAGELLRPIVVIVIFVTALLIGIHQFFLPGETLSPWIVIAGSLGFGMAGAFLVIGHFMDGDLFGRHQDAALPIGLVALVLFGGGGVLLLRRQLRRSRVDQQGCSDGG